MAVRLVARVRESIKRLIGGRREPTMAQDEDNNPPNLFCLFTLWIIVTQWTFYVGGYGCLSLPSFQAV
jgi:hypothetical protein